LVALVGNEGTFGTSNNRFTAISGTYVVGAGVGSAVSPEVMKSYISEFHSMSTCTGEPGGTGKKKTVGKRDKIGYSLGDNSSHTQRGG
jgi:hypothetical protein